MKTNLFVLLISLTSAPLASAIEPVYCNGQRVQSGGNLYYPNAQRVRYASNYLYPNGARTIYAGNRLYPNGKRMVYAGDELYMNGQRVLYAGSLYYPNGQRVEFAGNCYFNTGVRMASCPKSVRFRVSDGEFTTTGMIDLETKKILDQTYEHRTSGVSTFFDVETDGSITSIDALCD